MNRKACNVVTKCVIYPWINLLSDEQLSTPNILRDSFFPSFGILSLYPSCSHKTPHQISKISKLNPLKRFVNPTWRSLPMTSRGQTYPSIRYDFESDVRHARPRSRVYKCQNSSPINYLI